MPPEKSFLRRRPFKPLMDGNNSLKSVVAGERNPNIRPTNEVGPRYPIVNKTNTN